MFNAMMRDIEVAAVDHVHGHTICDFWDAPMTVVYDGNGDRYITRGRDYMAWLAVCGTVQTVAIGQCVRDARYTWIELDEPWS